MEYNKKILFTTTTYLAKKDKFNQVNIALDTFLRCNNEFIDDLISDFVIINEYDDNTSDSCDIIEQLKNKYPKFNFINKTKDQFGQAKSLNMIIDMLKNGGYKYWLHWEESWYCNGPILDKVYHIIENYNVTQIQFTNDWFDQLENDDFYNNNHEFHFELIPKSHLKQKWREEYYDNQKFNNFLWPLYSLRPHIIRADSVINTGYFTEDPGKWPVMFELDWAYRWILLQDPIKAVLKLRHVDRQDNHKSTYHE